MSLRRGGLGLHSLDDPSLALYISSFCIAGSVTSTLHLDKSISLYNSHVEHGDALSVSSLKENS